MEKVVENNKIKNIFWATKGTKIKIAKPKNSDKNKGIKNKANGIKTLN
jgi:hypothetical protein